MIFTPEWSAVLFGIAAAATWGAGDFNGGLAARRSDVVGVVAVSHGFGLLLLLALALITGEPMPGFADLIWGGIGGIVGMIGLVSLYRALSVSQMGIAAPISAVITAALPVLFSLVSRGLPEALQLLGFLLAFASVWLVSYSGSQLLRTGGLGFAVLSGIGFGVFFILLDQVASDAIFWPLVAARLASACILWGLMIFGRGVKLPTSRSVLPIVLLSSILDAAGNAFFLLAARSGRLDIAAVVSSFYPAATILLAWLILKEKLTRAQAAGVVVALVAIALIVA